MFSRKRKTPMGKAVRQLGMAMRIASGHLHRRYKPTAEEIAELVRFARLLWLNHSAMAQLLTLSRDQSGREPAPGGSRGSMPAANGLRSSKS